MTAAFPKGRSPSPKCRATRTRRSNACRSSRPVAATKRQAPQWLRKADALRTAIEERFWVPQMHYYAIAIDGDGAPCRVYASNAGHLLYCGVPSEERAALVAAQLMSARFSSGWGIRTLAEREPRYNPMSYHNGSIWPHDTSLCAAGISRYGGRANVVQILNDIFETANQFGMRLPELYCGFPRVAGQGPAPYPVACLPQAWASGSVFLLLQACLGIQVDGERKRSARRRARYCRSASNRSRSAACRSPARRSISISIASATKSWSCRPGTWTPACASWRICRAQAPDYVRCRRFRAGARPQMRSIAVATTERSIAAILLRASGSPACTAPPTRSSPAPEDRLSPRSRRPREPCGCALRAFARTRAMRSRAACALPRRPVLRSPPCRSGSSRAPDRRTADTQRARSRRSAAVLPRARAADRAPSRCPPSSARCNDRASADTAPACRRTRRTGWADSCPWRR